MASRRLQLQIIHKSNLKTQFKKNTEISKPSLKVTESDLAKSL